MATEGAHYVFGYESARGISLIHIVVPLFVALESFARCQHQGLELTGIDVRLHFQNPLNELRIGCNHTHAPSRHIVRLRQRIHLYGYVLGTRNTEDAQRIVVKNETIRVVVDNHYVVALAEIYQSGKKALRSAFAGGHVWIVDPHQFDSFERQAFEGIEIGFPTAFFGEVVGENLSLGESAHRCVGGIAGIWHQHAVAGIDEGERGVQNAFLRTDKRLNFGGGIEVDIVVGFIPAGKRLTQLRQTHIRLIAVRIGLRSLGA